MAFRTSYSYHLSYKPAQNVKGNTRIHPHIHHTQHGDLTKLFVFYGNRTWAKIREYTHCMVQKA